MSREVKTFELTISSERYVGHIALIGAIEKGLKDRKARVVSGVESTTCLICGQAARVVTTYGGRKKWWQFWAFPGPREYSFETDHPCMKEAAKEFARDDSPWKKSVKP